MKTWTRVFPALTLAAFLGLLAGCAGSETQDSTGGYIDDAAITTKVKTALVQDDHVSATNVHVETFKGKVQLSGFVKSHEESEYAEADADHVAGVKSVENDLQIKGD